MSAFFRTIILAGLFVLPPPGPAISQDSSSSEPSEAVEIQVSSAVGRLQQVAGRVKAPGRPVILVRADLPNEPWWVQGQPVPVGQDGFTAKAVFGSTTSQVGMRFRIVTILVDRNTPATEYRTGQIIRELPDVPKSRELLVTLGRTGRPVIALAPKEEATTSTGTTSSTENTTSTGTRTSSETETSSRTESVKEKSPVEFTSPKTGESVHQVAELTGKIQDGFTPIVLIRPLEKDSVWWIQKPVVLEKSGKFTSKVVVGSSRTPEGTRFRIVALAIPTKTSRKETSLDEFKPGEFLKELPKDAAASEELVLTLRRAETEQEKSTSRK